METKFKFKDVVLVVNEKSSFCNTAGTIIDYGKTADATGAVSFFYKVKFFWPMQNPVLPGTYTQFFLFRESELDVLPPDEKHFDTLPECPYPPVPQKHPELC